MFRSLQTLSLMDKCGLMRLTWLASCTAWIQSPQHPQLPEASSPTATSWHQRVWFSPTSKCSTHSLEGCLEQHKPQLLSVRGGRISDTSWTPDRMTSEFSWRPFKWSSAEMCSLSHCLGPDLLRLMSTTKEPLLALEAGQLHCQVIFWKFSMHSLDCNFWNSPEHLNAAFMRAVDNVRCNVRHNFHQPNLQFCAEDIRLRSDICSEDLGGPFVVLQRGQEVLSGISSIAVCQAIPANPIEPSLFTRVSGYSDWIVQQINMPIPL